MPPTAVTDPDITTAFPRRPRAGSCPLRQRLEKACAGQRTIAICSAVFRASPRRCRRRYREGAGAARVHVLVNCFQVNCL